MISFQIHKKLSVDRIDHYKKQPFKIIVIPTRAEEPEQFLGDTYRYSSEAAEGKLTWLCNAYQSYSLCPTEKYYILWDYISPVMEKIDPYCAAFSDLEICGYSLYESTLIVNILAKSSFTLDEAIAIYKIYPNTPTRMLELFLFNEYIKTLVNNQDISLAKHFYQWLLNAVY